MSCDVLDEPSPLGLRLRKSPSLVDLIQMKLSEAKAAAGRFAVDNNISEAPKKKEVQSPALTAGEQLKASNFPANVLKIGTWEYISRYEGDLVAKCYFAKHKLVWEVLDDGLKSKIEIQWSDITALKATYPENEQGTLDLVLARPPLFFKETGPQPRKHTLWHAVSDFTNGQASLNRRHTLQCPSTLLSKNFEKLIQCDQRLNELSQQADIILETPGFELRCSVFENLNESKDCHCFNNLKYERETSLPKFTDPVSPCAFSSPSKKVVQPEFPAQPINIGNLLLYGNNEEQSKEVLEDLVQYLFSDTQGPSASDDKYLMARVESFYNLLENDSVPSAMTKPEGNDSSNIGIVELDSNGSDEEPKSASARKTVGGTEPPTISRKDSIRDLLLNLPRIASIPQFMFDMPEDFDK